MISLRVCADDESGDPFSSQAHKCGMELLRLLNSHDVLTCRVCVNPDTPGEAAISSGIPAMRRPAK